MRPNPPLGAGLLPTPLSSRVHSYEQMMGSGVGISEQDTPPASDAGVIDMDDTVMDLDEEKEDRDMFLKLERPRVRYDVEVITKLIVYTGKSSIKSSFYFYRLTLQQVSLG
jgi:hypothetical protein